MKRLLLSIFALTIAVPGFAADRIPSHCIALSEREPQIPIRYASTALAPDEVALSYVGHSMYRIRSHGGVDVVTDYNGGASGVPDVVTMNRAHSSHWTPFPNPEIAHVLKGWGEGGTIADHSVEIGDMLVRNVTTDIRSSFTGVEPDGNSIFVFEVGGLCIGHLGHLHHEPTDEQFAAIGRLDVVMAAVDGGMTLELPKMINTLNRLRALVVLPMHWWGRGSLEIFLAGMRPNFAVENVQGDSLIVSLDTLPRKPTVYVMQPAQLPGFDD